MLFAYGCAWRWSRADAVGRAPWIPEEEPERRWLAAAHQRQPSLPSKVLDPCGTPHAADSPVIKQRSSHVCTSDACLVHRCQQHSGPHWERDRSIPECEGHGRISRALAPHPLCLAASTAGAAEFSHGPTRPSHVSDGISRCLDPRTGRSRLEMQCVPEPIVCGPAIAPQLGVQHLTVFVPFYLRRPIIHP
jgi:hypothetical protein